MRLCIQIVSFLFIFLSLNISFIKSEKTDQINDARDKRFVKDKKFGFFGGIAQMGKLAYEQYTDTTKTLQSILDLLNNSFSDTATEPPKSVTETSVTNETTTETYRISRKELGRILNRNFRGLQKLLRIEVNDAFNQTKYSLADYKRDFYKSVKKPRKNVQNDVDTSK